MSPINAPLEKKTVNFAHHQIPLECDVYDAPDYPSNTPVVLFFHSGGLVGGSRSMIPPWLVQTCHTRKWPLLSPSYRLLPQASGRDLLLDALAAYTFASSFSRTPSPRRIILAGASAGFLLPCLLAHNLPPPPFPPSPSSPSPASLPSTTPSSPQDDVAPFLSRSPEDVTVGCHPWDRSGIFHLESLLPDGTRNPAFDETKAVLPPGNDGAPERGLLYDYFLYENLFPDLVGGRQVDAGFDSPPATGERWPVTVMIQGDADDDVDPGVCRDVAGKLGGRAMLFVAEGKGHLFERTKFWEEVEAEGGLVAVRRAVEALDGVVRGA
ncbi:Alpha/Beta hydrolase protein [Schizothecium vesticola]|uniref:Alpha/Beta hydrolase protein n=1 Tax=Schizothecium vesticola TaxID=314040 RepID=A0AA40EXE4_9PEZI|nr:Alpha/Beta hydrolase protein [Schizothecium vesticola]